MLPKLISLLVLPLTCTIVIGCKRTSQRRTQMNYCTMRLGTIYRALSEYAEENSYFYPDGSLRQLHKNGYLDRADLHCSGNGEYIYRSGLTQYDKGPLCWDAPENHEEYGIVNVLFTDSRVRRLTVDEFKLIAIKNDINPKTYRPIMKVKPGH